MKIKSIIFGLIFIFIFILFTPYLLIQINELLVLPHLSYPVLKIFGIILAIISFLIITQSFWFFHFFGKGTPVPIEPPKKLVIKGLYKYSRNPMYISYMMIALSLFLYFGYILLFAYFLFAIIVIHLAVVYFEEPRLKKRFSKDYLDYFNKIPRWLI